MKHSLVSPMALNALLILATVLCFVLSLYTGSADISVSKGMADAYHSIVSMESLIVMELRLPRALLARGATKQLASSLLPA